MAIRFGVAGTAHWARSVHVPALLATPEVELVGLWGRVADKSTAIAKQYGLRSFERYEDMLECVEAVSIAVPPMAQSSLAIAAARAGRHLLLEKPVAVSLDDAVAIMRAARGHVAAVVFFMRRFVPEIENAIQRLVGRPWNSADVRVHSSALAADGPYSHSAWRQVYGAALWDSGPHVLSILIPVLGPVASVLGWREGQHHTRLTLQHESGAIANVSLTLHANTAEVIRQYTFVSGTERVTLPEPDFSHVAALSSAAKDLAKMIAGASHGHRCGLDLGLETVRVLEAAERSVRTAESVRVQRHAS